MARRGRRSEMEKLIDVAAMLPWWLALSIAVLSYGLLHPLAEAPRPQVTDPHDLAGPMLGAALRSVAMIGQYVLPAIFTLGAGLSALKARRNKRLLAEAKSVSGHADLANLSWEDFEHLVGEAFRARGFAVRETRPGPDGGVDLELRKNNELHLVQCKRWRARSVGVEIVRELYGVMAARGAIGGYVVSSGSFSQEARQFAAGRNIELWDGKTLKAVILGVERRPQQAKPITDRAGRSPGDTTPTCPSCGAQMVRRTAKRGAEAGKSFWGCSTFPKCRGTRPDAA
ncbi:hypothetical protein CKO23_21760 [Thiocystis violacea]|nr:hypothetical protein [Thiocystis violacea]